MHLYEATTVATLLGADDNSNLADLFEPGKVVGSYNSVEEYVELRSYYLNHENEQKIITRTRKKP